MFKYNSMKISAVAMCMLALVASSICQIAQSPLASQLVVPTNQLSAHETKKDAQADAGSFEKKVGMSPLPSEKKISPLSSEDKRT